MDYQKLNNETYNRSASALAAYFKSKGARVEDINRALELAGNPQEPRVIEIGCGDGRDAVEIVKRVASYEGFDPSTGLLGIAQKNFPRATFTEADALSFNYPKNQDIVFAFASLLHVPREDLEKVFQKVSRSLNKNGIFYISTKEADDYQETIKKDTFGKRIFYLYPATLLQELAGPKFSTVFLDRQMLGNTPWLTLAFKKVF